MDAKKLRNRRTVWDLTPPLFIIYKKKKKKFPTANSNSQTLSPGFSLATRVPIPYKMEPWGGRSAVLAGEFQPPPTPLPWPWPKPTNDFNETINSFISPPHPFPPLSLPLISLGDYPYKEAYAFGVVLLPLINPEASLDWPSLLR